MRKIFSYLKNFLFRPPRYHMELNEFFTLDVLKVAGLSDVSEEEKQLFIKKIGEEILLSVVKRIEKELPRDKREEFFRVFNEGGSEDDKVSFIENHIPNFEKMYIEEIVHAKLELLKTAKELKTSS